MARALQLASRALDDPALAAVAADALRGVFARPWRHANLDGLTLCHGAAGLLHITVRVTQLNPDPELTTSADALARRVLDGFDAAAPFGFRHRFDTPTHHTWVDEPGLLQGAAGVALALATYAGHPGPREADAWDSTLLLT